MSSPDASSIRVEQITMARFPVCWELRLRALREHPDAFGQSVEGAEKLTLGEASEQFRNWWDGGDNRTFGAFDPSGVPLGMTGVARETRRK